MMNLEVLHRWECLPYEINHTGVIFSSINRFFRKRKIHFCQKHFKPTEVISSDFCRGLVSDDENDQTVTGAAFDVLHYIVSKRMQLGKLTVVDATNVQESARKPLIEIAKDYHCFPVAVVFNLPEKVCQERNKNRTDRQVEEYVIRKHTQQLKKSIKGLQREGFRYVYILNSPEEVEEVVFERQLYGITRKMSMAFRYHRRYSRLL